MISFKGSALYHSLRFLYSDPDASESRPYLHQSSFLTHSYLLQTLPTTSAHRLRPPLACIDTASSPSELPFIIHFHLRFFLIPTVPTVITHCSLVSIEQANSQNFVFLFTSTFVLISTVTTVIAHRSLLFVPISH